MNTIENKKHQNPQHNPNNTQKVPMKVRVERSRISRRENTLRRNHDLRNRFNQLFGQERLRFDDAIHQLCIEFYMTDRVVRRILSSTDL